ncbi:unnamed protein product [Mytilus edulis]|uniref:Uncharacterized protein n=1 Tax=Mytilus edulis TaxID=6550 RepID=A0A8S3RLG8_MYTED|nr:unnamed protein product [Mytilus edulis]
MMAYHWMNYLITSGQASIHHKLNHGSEKRVGKYLVDGWDSSTNTIYQFHGFYLHGHQCDVTANIKDQRWIENREHKLKKTFDTTNYLKSQGYNVVEMWECDFQKKPQVHAIITKGRPTFYRKHPGRVNETQILNAVRSGDLFGMCQVDICVPEEWADEFKGQSDMTPHDYFAEMSPLFCNMEIPFDSFGQRIQEHVEKHNLSKKPRRLMVGGMKATEILIAAPLLKWYILHRMKVTKIHEVVEFQTQACFKNFVQEVSEASRQGDQNPDMAIIGETRKYRHKGTTRGKI